MHGMVAAWVRAGRSEPIVVWMLGGAFFASGFAALLY